MILAGDIGGTRARLALYSDDGKKVTRQETFESQAFKNVDAVLKVFLGTKPPRIAAATLGIAGPVIDQKCVATNLPWVVDGRALARKFKLKRFTLINDLVALGLGALTAKRSLLRPLTGGGLPKKKGANVAILAAGTGLGEAALVWDGARFVALPTEGGHVDFAARNPTEAELQDFLTDRFGRATYERVLSGPGLGNVYDFFRTAKQVAETPENEALLAQSSDRNAEVSRLGAAGKSIAAAKAVDMFVSIYGSEVGNLVLKTFALGGVYVAGNIAAHLEAKLREGEFVRSMRAKDPMSGLLEKVPVALVLDSTIGLSGAAYHAATTR